MDKSSSQKKWKKREDAALVAGGFEAIGGDLWKKGNCIYGRGAALQEVRRKLAESSGNRDEPPRRP
jgi:hypothetical protein